MCYAKNEQLPLESPFLKCITIQETADINAIATLFLEK